MTHREANNSMVVLDPGRTRIDQEVNQSFDLNKRTGPAKPEYLSYLRRNNRSKEQNESPVVEMRKDSNRSSHEELDLGHFREQKRYIGVSFSNFRDWQCP